jgi:hypothetical protein
MNNCKPQVPIFALCASVPSVLVFLCYHDTPLPHTAVALVALPPHKFASTSLSFQTVRLQFGVVLNGVTNSLKFILQLKYTERWTNVYNIG